MNSERNGIAAGIVALCIILTAAGIVAYYSDDHDEAARSVALKAGVAGAGAAVITAPGRVIDGLRDTPFSLEAECPECACVWRIEGAGDATTRHRVTRHGTVYTSPGVDPAGEDGGAR